MKRNNVKQLCKALALCMCAGAFVMSCGNSSGTSEASAAEAEAVQEDPAAVFLKDFYEKCVFGYSAEADSILEVNSTQNLLRTLYEAYEYEGDGYAYECLRTGYQDCDYRSVDTTAVVEVNKLEDGWYQVRYYDMGWKGSTRIRFAQVGDMMLMDEYVDDRGTDPFTVEGGEYLAK